MEYSFDIFYKNPERLATILAKNCCKRRLDKGLSRRSLSEITGIPEPRKTERAMKDILKITVSLNEHTVGSLL